MELQGIWANLPFELVALIIERTDDLTSLHNWCLASSGCLELQTAAFRRRHARTYLDLCNICLDPEIDRRSKKKRKRANQAEDAEKEDDEATAKKPCGLGDWLFEKDPVTNLLPAAFVRNLVLDLQQFPFHERDFWAAVEGQDPLWHFDRKPQPPPFIVDVEFTARRLLTQATHLHQVHQNGNLTQGILNAILGSAADCCNTFSFRGGTLDAHYLKYAPGNNTLPTMALDWTSLSQKTKLRDLTVHQLERGESSGLANALRSLKHLEHLKITVRKSGFPPFELGTFLAEFFFASKGESSGDGETTKLDIDQMASPSPLRSLELSGCVDTLVDLPPAAYHGIKDMHPDETGQSILPQYFANLEDIVLDIQDPVGRKHLSAIILSWFKSSPLRRISLPWNHVEHVMHGDLVSVPSISTILSKTGKSLTIHNICEMFKPSDDPVTVQSFEGDGISALLSPEYSPRTLVIGTRTPEFLNGARARNREQEVIKMGDEYATWKLLRSNTLHHLRLEQVELNILELDHFDFSRFENLRVLMLYPWAYTDSNWRAKAGTSHASSTSDPTTASSLPRSETPEARLLDDVIARAPKSLRVVFIGSFRIWLQRTEDGATPTPMPFTTAKPDLDEQKVMRSELCGNDWDFIDSIPQEPVQVLSPPARKFMANLWSSQHADVVRRRSYARYFRTNDK